MKLEIRSFWLNKLNKGENIKYKLCYSSNHNAKANTCSQSCWRQLINNHEILLQSTFLRRSKKTANILNLKVWTEEQTKPFTLELHLWPRTPTKGQSENWTSCQMASQINHSIYKSKCSARIQTNLHCLVSVPLTIWHWWSHWCCSFQQIYLCDCYSRNCLLFRNIWPNLVKQGVWVYFHHDVLPSCHVSHNK